MTQQHIHIHLHGQPSNRIHVHLHMDGQQIYQQQQHPHAATRRRRQFQDTVPATNTNPSHTTAPPLSFVTQPISRPTTEPLSTTISDLFRLFSPSTGSSSTLSSADQPTGSSRIPSTTSPSSLLSRIFDDPAVSDGMFRFYYTSLDNPSATSTTNTTNLPTIQELSKYTDYEIIENEECPLTCEECSICKIGYKERDIIRKLKACNHSFHIDCVDKWFEKSRNCPLCRCDISTLSTATVSSEQNQQDEEETSSHLDEIDQLLDTILNHP